MEVGRYPDRVKRFFSIRMAFVDPLDW
jgi:hypothetical protein